MISKDRQLEAQEVLKRLHDDHSDPVFWEKEYLQISAQLAVEKVEKETSKWNHMFTNRSELRRVAVAIASLTSVQTNGAQTIQIYQVRRPSSVSDRFRNSQPCLLTSFA